MAKTKKKTSSKKTKLVKPEAQEVSVLAKHLKISPRKLRLIVKGVSGLTPDQAEIKLSVASQKGAAVFLKALKNVIANAVNNSSLDRKTFEFKKITVDEAPGMVRRDRFHGARFNSGLIKRRRSHLTITITGKKKEK